MRQNNILASLTISQAILESGWGNSSLTTKYNNLFGIKGQGTDCKTFEYINGKRIDCISQFKIYPDWQSSVNDHSALLLRLTRYKNVVGEQDFTKACTEIQKAGYATAPDYAEALIKIIRQYKLYEYDCPKSRTYTIKKGDSWWRIALEQLGNPKRFAELAEFNGMNYNKVIYPGQVIRLPD